MKKKEKIKPSITLTYDNPPVKRGNSLVYTPSVKYHNSRGVVPGSDKNGTDIKVD